MEFLVVLKGPRWRRVYDMCPVKSLINIFIDDSLIIVRKHPQDKLTYMYHIPKTYQHTVEKIRVKQGISAKEGRQLCFAVD